MAGVLVVAAAAQEDLEATEDQEVAQVDQVDQVDQEVALATAPQM